MPETSLSDPVRSTEAQPTPPTALQGLTSSLGLLPAYAAAGSTEVGMLRSSAARQRTEAADLEKTMGAQAAERGATRPAVPVLPTPPDTTPRPFLSPGPSVMSQLQSVLTGVTQMALGIGGLRGGGYAIAALSGLKGAMEGWQVGDHERAKAALTDWKTNSEKLQADYQNRLESYRTILTDQKMDMANRLAMIGIRARIDGDEAAAVAAERGQIKDFIDILSQREMHAQDYDLKAKGLEKQIAQFNETSARHDRDFAALQARRAELNKFQQAASARADRALKLREENVGAVLKLEKEDNSINNSLRQMSALEESVARLSARGVIPKGATAADKLKASVTLQTSIGDEQVAQDIENVKRMGTALLVGSEIAAGLSPSVARLKVIGEAEAAGATAIPKSFWDQWFVRQRQMLGERRDTVRSHLKTRAPAQPEAAEPEIVMRPDD
jgi:hypothetical protein